MLNITAFISPTYQFIKKSDGRFERKEIIKPLQTINLTATSLTNARKQILEKFSNYQDVNHTVYIITIISNNSKNEKFDLCYSLSDLRKLLADEQKPIPE